MEEIGFVSLLRAAWLLLTLPVVIAWFPLPGLGWLRGGLLEFSKRGKSVQTNTKFTLPQKTFCHFYVIGILWTTMLLVAVWSYAITMLPSLSELDDLSSNITSHLHKSLSMREHVYHVWLSVFMLLLMEFHVLRRFYESFYVFNYSPSARMHIVLYFGGVFFYIATPLSLCCSFAPEVFDFVKNMWASLIVNGKDSLIARPELNISTFVTPFLSLRWYAWMGAAIFLWGWVHQLRCHEILGSLRKKPEKQGEYFIPSGDWFKYVSSPHYTAEIVIYGGLLVASGGTDLSLWLLFALVVTNLGFASMITHEWYVQKFEDYPPNRCAIFPFIY